MRLCDGGLREPGDWSKHAQQLRPSQPCRTPWASFQPQRLTTNCVRSVPCSSTMPHSSLTSLAATSSSRPLPVLSAIDQVGRSALALWHLLSLDAPTVATLWTWYIALSVHTHLSPCVPAAMFAAVWTLYAADRLLDSRILATAPPSLQIRSLLQVAPRPAFESPRGLAELEARHIFHHRHRRPMIAGICSCALLLAALVPAFEPAVIDSYFVLGSLLFVYFLLIHTVVGAHRLSKEISVGFFFSAAVFIPTMAHAPQMWRQLLPLALLFALLCSLNCLFIYSWEHGPERTVTGHPAPHWITGKAIPYLPTLALILVALSLLFLLATGETTPIPIGVAAFLLFSLHRLRGRFDPVTLRAAADLVLLTPVPLLLLRHAV